VRAGGELAPWWFCTGNDAGVRKWRQVSAARSSHAAMGSVVTATWMTAIHGWRLPGQSVTIAGGDKRREVESMRIDDFTPGLGILEHFARVARSSVSKTKSHKTSTYKIFEK